MHQCFVTVKIWFGGKMDSRGGGFAMSDLNFDPTVGEEVRVLGRPGLFRVVRVYKKSSRTWRTKGDVGPQSSPLELMFVDLKSEEIGRVLTDVPAHSETLKFDETHPVRCAIEWLKENPVVPFPDYLVDYQVEARNDHQGNPAFYVRFFVEPDDQPSPEKIKELNRFLSSVQTLLLSLGLDRWPYVQVSEKRSLLDVAS
jgi:hypothetical protein